MKYYKISEIAKLESVSQKFIRKEIAKKVWFLQNKTINV